MKKNDSINFLFLFLCVLLLGFVYLNNRMAEHNSIEKQKASYSKEEGSDKKIKGASF